MYTNVEKNNIHDTIARYIYKRQMFTVYQIWIDTQYVTNSLINYNDVRRIVEGLINDAGSKIPGWTRSIGNHLRNLDNRVGKAGEPPQIYHLVGADITKYDPDFRLNSPSPVANHPRHLIGAAPINTNKKASKKGLFKFKVWHNSNLVNCSLVNPRGPGGKFIQSQDYEGRGVLDNDVPVIVKQDNEGKLYATVLN